MDLFDLSRSLLGDYLKDYSEEPYKALSGLKEAILNLGKSLDSEYAEVKEHVWIHKSAIVAVSASIAGPAIIGANSEIRHNAFIRGSVLVGDNCVVGNSVELKNVILFDCVQVPHFNYVGDSILGYKAHMGAGSITSNVKSDHSEVVVAGKGTGLVKFGALLGDHVEVGCNAVLNPGSIVGKNSFIYPLVCFRGVVGEGMIVKANGEAVIKNV